MREGPQLVAGAADRVHVLVVDDEPMYRDTLCKVLARRGLHAQAAASGEDALRILAEGAWDVMVLDLKMPGLDGLRTLDLARRTSSAEVILLTGHGSVDAGVQAMSERAFDFLLKPTSADELVGVIAAAAASRRARLAPGSS